LWKSKSLVILTAATSTDALELELEAALWGRRALVVVALVVAVVGATVDR